MGSRLRPVNNSFDFVLIHLAGLSRDDIPQERNCVAIELTFLGLNVQLILKEALKDLANTDNLLKQAPGKKI